MGHIRSGRNLALGLHVYVMILQIAVDGAHTIIIIDIIIILVTFISPMKTLLIMNSHVIPNIPGNVPGTQMLRFFHR